MPDASDMSSVALASCPIDGFALGLECSEDVVRMVFDHIIGNGTPFRTTLGAGLNVDTCHTVLSLRGYF